MPEYTSYLQDMSATKQELNSFLYTVKADLFNDMQSNDKHLHVCLLSV